MCVWCVCVWVCVRVCAHAFMMMHFKLNLVISSLGQNVPSLTHWAAAKQLLNEIDLSSLTMTIIIHINFPITIVIISDQGSISFGSGSAAAQWVRDGTFWRSELITRIRGWKFDLHWRQLLLCDADFRTVVGCFFLWLFRFVPPSLRSIHLHFQNSHPQTYKKINVLMYSKCKHYGCNPHPLAPTGSRL